MGNICFYYPQSLYYIINLVYIILTNSQKYDKISLQINTFGGDFMDISILATQPLQLYKDSFFKSAHDEYVAKGIGYLIHYLYSGTIFPTPVFKEIKRVDFEIIRKMVFKALDYAANCGYRKHTQEIDDTRHFFGLDGHERIPSYVEIAKIRNLQKVSVVEFNVKITAARIGVYLQNNCIDIMLTDPNGSNNSMDSLDLLMMIDGIISDIEKMLAKVEEMRKKVAEG